MDIVWFAEIKWDYLKTRKQQIISRKPDDVRILYLEPYVRGRQNRFSVRREGNGIFCATVPFIKSAPGGLWRRALDHEFVRSAVDVFARIQVERLLTGLRFDRKNLGKIFSNIYSIRVASRTSGRFLLYDCNDAHASFPGMPHWSEAYYKEACRLAHGVFASSRSLVRAVSEVRGSETDVQYLGNGVDFARFQIDETETPLPVDQAKTRIVYLGALAPWVDFESLRALAERHPEWDLGLIGPVLHGAERDVAGLESLSNVSLYEPVPYEEVPRVLKHYNIALIPFRYNTLTRGVNPNKLYEYLAAGIPVVVTRFSEEVQMFPEVVRTAEPGEPFVKACEETVRLLCGESRRRTAETAKCIAKENDWSTIAESFWKRVNKMMTES